MTTLNELHCNTLIDSTLLNSHTYQQEQGSVTCSYDSHQSFSDHLTYAAGSIFQAVSMAKEVNKLNGYEVVSKHELKKIKDYYMKYSSPCDSNTAHDSNNESKERNSASNYSDHSVIKMIHEQSFDDLINNDKFSHVKIEKVGLSKSKREQAGNVYRNLQKGYMSLLVDYKG